jgi:large subunit ribosomal protein L18
MTYLANKKRSQRIRKKLKKVNTDRYRLSVYRSARNISAQIIDDKSNKTVISATSVKKNVVTKKKDSSLQVAEKLAKMALEKKIKKVFFDRGSYRYHGRIKSFADAL